jgi:predicted TIM-barrel fold metal-dependent hydrolase
MTVDVWMQHPTLRFLRHEMLDSVRRWTGRMQSRSGRRKVMFGTNYPMIAPEAALADLDGLELDDEARELFLAGNARRVFGLDPSPR